MRKTFARLGCFIIVIGLILLVAGAVPDKVAVSETVQVPYEVQVPYQVNEGYWTTETYTVDNGYWAKEPYTYTTTETKTQNHFVIQRAIKPLRSVDWDPFIAADNYWVELDITIENGNAKLMITGAVYGEIFHITSNRFTQTVNIYRTDTYTIGIANDNLFKTVTASGTIYVKYEETISKTGYRNVWVPDLVTKYRQVWTDDWVTKYKLETRYKAETSSKLETRYDNVKLSFVGLVLIGVGSVALAKGIQLKNKTEVSEES